PVHSIEHRTIEPSREVYRRSVGEVSAMGEIEAQYGVPGLQTGVVYRGIGLGPGMGLYIGIDRTKEFLGPINGELFHLVDHFTSPVMPFSGISLSILVGQFRSGRLHDLGADKVLGSD